MGSWTSWFGFSSARLSMTGPRTSWHVRAPRGTSRGTARVCDRHLGGARRVVRPLKFSAWAGATARRPPAAWTAELHLKQTPSFESAVSVSPTVELMLRTSARRRANTVPTLLTPHLRASNSSIPRRGVSLKEKWVDDETNPAGFRSSDLRNLVAEGQGDAGDTLSET